MMKIKSEILNYYDKVKTGKYKKYGHCVGLYAY